MNKPIRNYNDLVLLKSQLEELLSLQEKIIGYDLMESKLRLRPAGLMLKLAMRPQYKRPKYTNAGWRTVLADGICTKLFPNNRYWDSIIHRLVNRKIQ